MMVVCMRVSISTQLFAVMLGLCLLVILAMGSATTWSLREGFNDYTRQQDSQRAEAVTATLAALYLQQGSWNMIRQHPHLWYDILSMDDPERSPVGASGVPVIPARLRTHWSLVDPRTREVIAGNTEPNRDAQRFGIQIGGELVGQLVVSARQRAVSKGEERFLAQQRRSAVLIMLLSTGMAFIAALLLARRFLAPIRELADGTHQLAVGKYDVRINAHRQDELGQLAHDFNGLARTLDQNERLRRDFVADISHELRTPLAILTGELEAISDGIRKPTPEAIHSLQNEVSALTRLVGDLYQLALSDVGGLRYQMQSLDLGERVNQTAQSFYERMNEHGLTLKVIEPETPVCIEGDPERITQLIVNLLENSLRYTDSGGEVHLKLSQQDHQAVIDVEDTTPGVASEDLPRLFERLYRVEGSRNRATGGAGLGLPLCLSIVEAHHGQMTAKPSSMGGLHLHVVFPLLSQKGTRS
jgi:two-component system sensor histidine kinase BaeS